MGRPGFRNAVIDLTAKSTQLKILHVVDAFGGGVETAINDYIASTPEARHLVFARPRAGFRLGAVPVAETMEMPRGHIEAIRHLTRLTAAFQPSVIHAHSSIGGAYARLVRRGEAAVVYTPHCFAFERKDVGVIKRSAFWIAEALFKQNTDRFAAVSEREMQLAARLPGNRAVTVVPHVPHLGADVSLRLPIRTPACVVGFGRVQRQKGTDFFAAVALAMSSDDLQFRWIGGGDSARVNELRRAGVEVTGWLDRASAIEAIGHADVYLHTASWEGLPLTVVEASALGVPVIARSIPAMEGVVHCVGEHPVDVVRLIRRAIAGDRQTVGLIRQTHETIRSTFTIDNQRQALARVYAHARDFDAAKGRV